MADLPRDLQSRRAIEDKLVELGAERRNLEAALTKNTTAIVRLVPKAINAGIPFDGIAKLVGVSRQTLYRWQEVARRVRAEG